jgi:hypothetical protein
MHKVRKRPSNSRAFFFFETKQRILLFRSVEADSPTAELTRARSER